MEQFSILERNNVSSKFNGLVPDKQPVVSERSQTNPVLGNILSEGGDDFFQYLNWIGLTKEPNLMVLSSMQHYYYDYNDLKGIRTLINLKKLNQVRHLESFLHTLCRILPCKAYFVGCFKDTNHDGIGSHYPQPMKFLNGLMNIFDSGTERSLTNRGVTKLLEEHCFKVIDITYISGIAYFWAQNNRKPVE